MKQPDLDRMVYALAQEFLLGFDGVTPALLAEHLTPDFNRPDSLPDIYLRLLVSAQSANMGPAVIGKALGGVERLALVLDGFDPAAVTQRYATWETLLDTIERELRPTGQIRRAPKSLWPRFCRAALSGAQFLAQFTSAEDFYRWADGFDADPRTRPALPMLLSLEITGLGFALACDFIKEVGYLNFGKPDVHLEAIFTALGLSPDSRDYTVFKAIVRMAGHTNATAYAIDKTFWLIGSGNFYRNDLQIGRQREAFMAYARPQIAEKSAEPLQ